MLKKVNKTAGIKKHQQGYKKRKRKTKNFNEKAFQKKCLETNFNYSQYWLISCAQVIEDNKKLKFKTIIQARSSISAINILKKKTNSDNPNSKIINLKIKMFHKNFKLNRRKLSLVNWMDIKNCSFPNEVNILFKKHDS